MILIGFSCPGCKGYLLDSLDHCHHCGKPYEGTLAVAAKAHNEAKLAMVAEISGKPISKQRMLEDVQTLASVSQGIAATEKAGGTVPEGMISKLFRKLFHGENDQ